MGCQSQRQNNLNDRGRPKTDKKNKKRKHSSTGKQTTLAGDLAFNPLKDYTICSAEHRNEKKLKTLTMSSVNEIFQQESWQDMPSSTTETVRP